MSVWFDIKKAMCSLSALLCRGVSQEGQRMQFEFRSGSCLLDLAGLASLLHHISPWLHQADAQTPALLVLDKRYH
jgi:hypothetical protein